MASYKSELPAEHGDWLSGWTEGRLIEARVKEDAGKAVVDEDKLLKVWRA